mmetsp:Transcript_5974/g.25218  ORF Transcript_5974/g.25218 Transcript_5974/m.25218 type:complete len:112 (+) Transcript_5974:338-673(+)
MVEVGFVTGVVGRSSLFGFTGRKNERAAQRGVRSRVVMAYDGSRVKVGVLGCTGSVGQRFMTLLEDHPWFDVVGLGASPRSAGKKYNDAVSWKQASAIPEYARAPRKNACV